MVVLSHNSKMTDDISAKRIKIHGPCGDPTIAYNGLFSFDAPLTIDQILTDESGFHHQLYCINGHELCKPDREGEFIHKNALPLEPNTSDNPSSNQRFLKTSWHSEWQKTFKQTEKTIGKHRVDAIIEEHKIIIEFQHSAILKTAVSDRGTNARKNGYRIVWILDGSGLQISKNQIIDFTNNVWMYLSFLTEDFVFVHSGSVIYQLQPQHVRFNKFTSKITTDVQNLIASLESGVTYRDEQTPQCTFYFNQRGAGNGKTFESVHLHEDPRFASKHTIIYLVQQHSAKQVIVEKFKETKIHDVDECLEKFGKQYRFQLKRNDLSDVNVIIGTVDSFMWAIGNRNRSQGTNFFIDLARRIADGAFNTTKHGSVRYAGDHNIVDSGLLIVQDEAQDLCDVYFETYKSIQRNTYADVFVIGDLMQSIKHNRNLMTKCLDLLPKNNRSNQLKQIDFRTIDFNFGDNLSRRFKNTIIPQCVNNIFREAFQEYGVPSFQEICIGPENKHKIPFEVNLMHSEKEKRVHQILEHLTNDVDEGCYEPSDVLVIFAFVGKDPIAGRLHEELCEFWMNRGKGPGRAFLHKSEDNQPIDLQRSEKHTRIVSIHSSKGDGRPLVYVVNLAESQLQRFSAHTIKTNLIYESLLLVVLTRAKHKCQIFVEKNDDDVGKRLRSKNAQAEQQLPKFVTLDSGLIVSEMYQKNSVIIENFVHQWECTGDELATDSSTDEKTTSIITEWHHHQARQDMCVYQWRQLTNEITLSEIGDQFREILRKISLCTLNICSHQEYMSQLRQISKINEKRRHDWEKGDKKHENIVDFLPIYEGPDAKQLLHIMQTIQAKIKTSLRSKVIPDLCPIETVVFRHFSNVYDEGYFHKSLDVLQLYEFVSAFQHGKITCHPKFNCHCRELVETFTRQIDSEQTRLFYESALELGDRFRDFQQLLISNNIGDVKHFNVDTKVSDGDYRNTPTSAFIRAKFTQIGDNDKHVICFHVKPELNVINIRDFLTTFAVDVTIARKSDKYRGKQMWACIITFKKVTMFKVDDESIFLHLRDVVQNHVEKYLTSVLETAKYCHPNDHVKQLHMIDEKLKPKALSPLTAPPRPLAPPFCLNFFQQLSEVLCNDEEDDDDAKDKTRAILDDPVKFCSHAGKKIRYFFKQSEFYKVAT